MENLEKIKGSIHPIITPISNGQIDYAAYANLVEFQINLTIEIVLKCSLMFNWSPNEFKMHSISAQNEFKTNLFWTPEVFQKLILSVDVAF